MSLSLSMKFSMLLVLLSSLLVRFILGEGFVIIFEASVTVGEDFVIVGKVFSIIGVIFIIVAKLSLWHCW